MRRGPTVRVHWQRALEGDHHYTHKAVRLKPELHEGSRTADHRNKTRRVWDVRTELGPTSPTQNQATKPTKTRGGEAAPAEGKVPSRRAKERTQPHTNHQKPAPPKPNTKSPKNVIAAVPVPNRGKTLKDEAKSGRHPARKPRRNPNTHNNTARCASDGTKQPQG
jgi:hypothetical protein